MRNKLCHLGYGIILGSVALGLIRNASAAAPLVTDLIAPPPNINVVMGYENFSNAGSFYTPNGTRLGQTRIETDVPVLRLVHIFKPIDGIIWGAQVIEPYVAFPGEQKIGGTQLSANSGFAEPLLSAFAWPVNDPAENQYLLFAYFLSPPTGAYNNSYALNASSNNWINDLEVAYGHIIFGNPQGRRLDFQIWSDTYLYSNNASGTYNPDPALGNLTVHTEPAEQLVVYLPYYFHPATAGYLGLGFEQTFGGKVTDTFSNIPSLVSDTGIRNDVTSVSIIGGTFLTKTLFLNGQISTDVRARGGARNAISVTFQIGKVF